MSALIICVACGEDWDDAHTRALEQLTPCPNLADHAYGMSVDDLIDNIDELLASRTPESTEGDT